jgi:hypothetical protein
MKGKTVLIAGLVGLALALTGAASASALSPKASTSAGVRTLFATASAKHHGTKVKLPLIPLRNSQFGSASSSLPLEFGSGVQSDNDAAFGAGVSPKKIKKMGRITGYQLIYGDFLSAGPSLDQLQSSVDQYKTAADAKKALPFWKKLTLQDTKGLTQMTLTATEASISQPKIGSSHWATLQTFSIPNNTSLYFLNEEFSDGNYVLDIAVGAGSESAAKSYANKAAHALDKRLHLALRGKLKGSVVGHPKPPQAGPPSSGPDPQGMVLTTDDFAFSQLLQNGYDGLPVALSTYDVVIGPADNFDQGLFQSVSLMPSPESAAYWAAFNGAEEVAFELFFAGPAYTQLTPVDLTSIGDDAQGVILQISGSGQTLNEAIVTLDSGSVSDFVIADASQTIAPSDVQSLAQKAANRLNAGLGQ